MKADFEVFFSLNSVHFKLNFKVYIGLNLADLDKQGMIEVRFY